MSYGERSVARVLSMLGRRIRAGSGFTVDPAAAGRYTARLGIEFETP